ncbi:MAG: SDR family oxidoreductase [Chitinophagales bacterium]
MNLSGHTILITGATSGIGLGLAEKFLELDNQVIICGRREERLRKIKDIFPSIESRVCDMSDKEARKNLFDWTISNYPAIDVLVNNAGVQLAVNLQQEVNLDKVHEELEVNFVAPVHFSSLFTPYLEKAKEPAIINISSGLAFAPLAFMPIYCASKAAIHSYSLSLRRQLRNTSIKVFEIVPPSVDTELGHERRASKTLTHGGIPVKEFVEATMELLKKDQLEGAVGQAIGLYTKRESMFETMNDRVSR